jgi:hypothetical protein
MCLKKADKRIIMISSHSAKNGFGTLVSVKHSLTHSPCTIDQLWQDHAAVWQQLGWCPSQVKLWVGCLQDIHIETSASGEKTYRLPGNQNSDNWFGFGLYKALMPLATRRFDGSIQSRIAEQTLRRLEPMGFDADVLDDRLEIAQTHSDESLYEDPTLVTDLLQKAYAYLQEFGIQYVLVVLDELETVAETATFGLELDDTKRLDGQAIRLIGKAIKEEDPRRKLPWLRYVALCSPLLGQELRGIQSVARRFEPSMWKPSLPFSSGTVFPANFFRWDIRPMNRPGFFPIRPIRNCPRHKCPFFWPVSPHRAGCTNGRWTKPDKIGTGAISPWDPG